MSLPSAWAALMTPSAALLWQWVRTAIPLFNRLEPIRPIISTALLDRSMKRSALDITKARSSSVSVALEDHLKVAWTAFQSDMAVGRDEMSDLLPSSRPVSYTHLRAHETRHDLVCRLLL